MALTVLVGLGVSACGSDDDSSMSTMSAESAVDLARPGEVSDSASTEGGAFGQESTSPEAPAATAPTSASVDLSGQALAIQGGVTVAASNIRRAVDDTLVAIGRNNASVYTADVNIGEELEDGSVSGSGYFVVKIPPADLELLITDLDATVGAVTGRTQDTADVTEQLVDLEIRIGVERSVIERFQTLLDQATSFQDIVEIERVISERTIALEQLLAGQRNLENRVELSTLTINLQYVAPSADVVTASDDGIADAWSTGWDVFLGVMFTVGLVLAVAAPFIVAGLVVFGFVMLIGHRLRHRGDSTSKPESADADVTPRDDVLAAPSRDE